MNRTNILLGLMVAAVISMSPAIADDAKAYFTNLKDGDIVSSPFVVKFGLDGMVIAPAGNQDVANSGHHHLLIDTKLEGKALTQPIPADAKHVHFGKGQTEATLELPAGQHTLQLLVGDWKHMPHAKPVMSAPITVTVK